MIATIVLLAWLASVLVTFLFCTYKVAYWFFSGQRSRDFAKWDNKYKDTWGHVKWADPYRNEKRFAVTAGVLVSALALSAAGVFGLPVVIAIFAARNKANNEKRQAEAERESLKVLARYEEDPAAKKALESGDVSGYVDRLLDLDRPAHDAKIRLTEKVLA